jgi:hypothetical protein
MVAPISLPYNFRFFFFFFFFKSLSPWTFIFIFFIFNEIKHIFLLIKNYYLIPLPALIISRLRLFHCEYEFKKKKKKNVTI